MEIGNLMMSKDFRKVAEIIFDKTMEIVVPYSINLTINIDREKQIIDLENQMQKVWEDIENSTRELNISKIFEDLSKKTELKDKQELLSNKEFRAKAENIMNEFLVKYKLEQYENIIASISRSLNAILQGVIDGASKL